MKKIVPLKEAISAVKSLARKSKFDSTIDINLKVKTGKQIKIQPLRNSLVLHKGLSKGRSILVFARGKQADEAKAAGAAYVGGEELIKKVEEGELLFDGCLCTPDMFPAVTKIARVLGPRGLMPNVKRGTVTQNVGEAVRQANSSIQFFSDRHGLISSAIGKASFSPEEIEKNVHLFLQAVKQAADTQKLVTKGGILDALYLKSTQSAAIPVDCSKIGV